MNKTYKASLTLHYVAGLTLTISVEGGSDAELVKHPKLQAMETIYGSPSDGVEGDVTPTGETEPSRASISFLFEGDNADDAE